MRFLSVFAVAVVLAAGCTCQRRSAMDTPIAELQPCPEDERCETGLCDTVTGSTTAVCLRPCTQGCRGADVCTRLGDGRYGCVPERAGLCKPCTRDADCPHAADKCVIVDGSGVCGRDCSFDGTCPPSYRCETGAGIDGEPALAQCIPLSGTCACTAATAGQQVPCENVSDAGLCVGARTCRPTEGYTACSAQIPIEERCNGIDDDCDGLTDEALGDVTCGLGECLRSAAACANGTPQQCLQGTATLEMCNGRDDDCNGTTDDPFDLQRDPNHCGACNQPCVLTNAQPGCDGGMCAIARCTPGWTDLDHVAANGCEYPCIPSDAGVEICDGLDNDCNGLVDEIFDLVNDPTHCGRCDLACSVSGGAVATYSCSARICGIANCAAGFANCNQQYADGCEVSIATEVSHCGACNHACVTANATPRCASGNCEIDRCAAGYANCNNQVFDGCEVSTDTDLFNCGSCGTPCTTPNATPRCATGSCTIQSCNTGFANCNSQTPDGCEIDIRTSLDHCGGCNQPCAPAHASPTCSGGTCGITSCSAGYVNLNGTVSDGCEYACTVSNGGTEACDRLDNDCDGQTDEDFNLSGDLSNCGSCGRVCGAPHGTPMCLSGLCTLQSCDTGFANCNNQIPDGCEIDIRTSLSHCGGCNQPCAPAHATAVCGSGTCSIGSCNAGWVNLNGTVSDGCEYACTVTNGGTEICDSLDNDCDGRTDEDFNLTSDLANCGMCGRACAAPNGTPQCLSGTCIVQSCATGYANCNNQVPDGCEVDIRTSIPHCGGCNQPCAPAHASPVCGSGMCSIGSCNAGWVNLNGTVSDGCEYACTVTNGGTEICDSLDNDCDGLTDEGFTLATDLSNCGMCGRVCTTAHGTPQCSSGQCGVQSCNVGYANCNNQVPDGCEVDIRTSIPHCGGCNQPCAPANAVPVCSNGTCDIGSCLPGTVNLNGLVGDGCEYLCTVTNGGVELCDSKDNDCDGLVDEDFTLSNDVSNCGSCGHACSAPNVSIPGCASSACYVQQCVPGSGNCNGFFADGCEIDTNSSLSHCGACNSPCTTPHANPVCSTGSCQIAACVGSYRDCNASPVDGCEVNVDGNVDACGSCPNVCPMVTNATRTCSGNSCGFTCLAGFVDLDGLGFNGCEYSCTPTGFDEPDDASTDTDCDGIDGAAASAIFVALTGSDAWPGTRNQPKRTVQAAINAASVAQPHIYVSTGQYDENLTLRDGVSVFGGYSALNSWVRNTSSYPVTIHATALASGRVVGVSGTNLTSSTTLAYLQINTVDGFQAGVSTYGLYCSGCTGLKVRTTTIAAGQGTTGSNGGNGSIGANGNPGDPGVDGDQDGAAGPGGNGGSSSCGREGGHGGAGGPEGNNTGITGDPGNVGTPGGPGGPGCRRTCGNCAGGPGTVGTDGTTGAAGADGAAGSGPMMSGGFLVCTAGGNGANGAHGNGGGGGGGGGGQGGNCVNDGGGNGAGGGGSGGCGGTQAFGGTGGGSSFAVFLVNSTGATFSSCSLTSANAGTGGAGGTGGAPGTGASGGLGATHKTDEIGAGGNGGKGGDGGRGGHGGGGSGGLSYALYKVGTTPTMISVTYAHGTAGLGGTSPVAPGVPGTAADSN